MALMLARLYDALTAAGAPEDKAIAAAEEAADERVRLASIDGKLTLLIWAVGINAAATIAIFGLLWQLASAVATLNSAIGGLHR